MADERFDLTRRKALASLGGIGAGAALGGTGTMAFLNDSESVEGNTMTAGTLDLKLDWQQQYYGPSGSWEYVNAHPDHDGDGEQSIEIEGETYEYSDDDRNIVDQLTCENLTEEYDYNGQDSLIELDDVKPGDEGEITFSLHLCDNPGYVWLTADNFTQSGGATTDPEESEGADDGELAENTHVEIWYDEDCDNELDRSGEEGQELEVALVSDVSGSMDDSIGDLKSAATGFVDNLSSPDEGAAISFSSDASLDQELTTDYQAIKDAIDAYDAGGGTNMAAGIDTARDELINGTNATTGANKVMILLSDGEPNSESDAEDAATAAKDDGIRLFTIALGSADTAFLEGIASSPDDAYVAPDPADLDGVYAEIAQVVISGEQVILGEGDGEHDGPVTLAQAMDIIDRNGGMVPLDGDGDMPYGARDTAEERDCFEAGTGHCIGMRWWVPEDVGNVIQGDEMAFDLGFYAEQCRHNDGARTNSA